MRVPTPNVSVVDLTVTTEKPVTVESINAAMKRAAEGPMKGILQYEEEELVSVDFRGNPHSSIVDAGYTRVVAGNCAKVLAWYDNEWGYSCRCRDLIKFMAAQAVGADFSRLIVRSMNKLSIRDLELSGKRVFVRVDFNVPLENGKVTDDTRIRETLPTLKLARERGARLVLASHLGRPKGKPDAKYSLRPVAWKLADLLGASVEFAADCVGAEAEAKSRALDNGSVLLLENVRFHREEEANDEGFSRQLAALCDGLFVCDAFGSAHRAHASVVGITRFVKQSAAGLLMERELSYLGKTLSSAGAAVRGGAGRGQSVRQDRSGRKPDEDRGWHADRRGHGLHVFEVAGDCGGQVHRGGGQDRSGGAGACGCQSARSSGCCCRPIMWSAPNFARTRRRARCR